MCACNWNFNCIINNTPLWLVNDLALEQTRIRTYMHAIRVITHTHRGRQSTSASEANMQTQITLLDNNLGHLALQNVICVGVIKFPDKCACAWWLDNCKSQALDLPAYTVTCSALEVENDYTEIDGPDQSQQRVSHHSQWELSPLTEGN